MQAIANVDEGSQPQTPSERGSPQEVRADMKKEHYSRGTSDGQKEDAEGALNRDSDTGPGGSNSDSGSGSGGSAKTDRGAGCSDSDYTDRPHKTETDCTAPDGSDDPMGFKWVMAIATLANAADSNRSSEAAEDKLDNKKQKLNDGTPVDPRKTSEGSGKSRRSTQGSASPSMEETRKTSEGSGKSRRSTQGSESPSMEETVCLDYLRSSFAADGKQNMMKVTFEGAGEDGKSVEMSHMSITDIFHHLKSQKKALEKAEEEKETQEEERRQESLNASKMGISALVHTMMPNSPAGKERRVVDLGGNEQSALPDDGYKWRKYGQKIIKLADDGQSAIKSYYRCTTSGCPMRKQVERSCEGKHLRKVHLIGEAHNHEAPSAQKTIVVTQSF